MSQNSEKLKNKGGRTREYEQPTKGHTVTPTDEGWDGFVQLAREYNLSATKFLDKIGKGEYRVYPNDPTKIGKELSFLPEEIQSKIDELSQIFKMSPNQVAAECLKIAFSREGILEKTLYAQYLHNISERTVEIAKYIGEESPQDLETSIQSMIDKMQHRSP